VPNRILREGLRTSRKLAVTNAEGHRMFTSLLPTVDDYGRFDADPVVVRAACFPRQLDVITVEHIAAWLDQLEAVHLLVRYRVGRDQVLQLLNTRSRVRANGSKCPDPPPEVQKIISQWEADGPPDGVDYCRGIGTAKFSSPTACMHAPVRARTQPCVPALVEERGSRNVDRGTRNEGKHTVPSPPAGGLVFDADFTEFWNLYPKVTNNARKPALLKYRSARRGGASSEELLEALAYELELREAAKRTGEFFPAVPHAKTWIYQERWVDLLAMKRDRAAGAARAAADRERAIAQERHDRLLTLADLRRHAREIFERKCIAMTPEERAGLAAELDEFDRGRGGQRPSENQAAGGAV
jgi:hypothetical protein